MSIRIDNLAMISESNLKRERDFAHTVCLICMFLALGLVLFLFVSINLSAKLTKEHALAEQFRLEGARCAAKPPACAPPSFCGPMDWKLNSSKGE